MGIGMDLGYSVGEGIRIRIIGCVEDDYSEEHDGSAREGGVDSRAARARLRLPRLSTPL